MEGQSHEFGEDRFQEKVAVGIEVSVYGRLKINQ